MNSRFILFLKKHKNTNTVCGDFANYALGDMGFPETDSYLDIASYLKSKNATPEVLSAFKKLWEKSGL